MVLEMQRYCIFRWFCCNHVHNGLGTTSKDPRQLLSLAVVHVALQGVTSERTSWLRKGACMTIWHAELTLLHEIWETNPCWCLSHLFFETIRMEPSSCAHNSSENLPDLLVFLQQAPLPFSTESAAYSASWSAGRPKHPSLPGGWRRSENSNATRQYALLCHADIQETGSQTLMRSPSLCSASQHGVRGCHHNWPSGAFVLSLYITNMNFNSNWWGLKSFACSHQTKVFLSSDWPGVDITQNWVAAL